MSIDEENDDVVEDNTKCIRCNKVFLPGKNSIGCDKCEGWLHLKCAGLNLIKSVLTKTLNILADTAPIIPVENVQSLFIPFKMELSVILMTVRNGIT